MHAHGARRSTLLHFNGQTWTRVQGTSARRAATGMFRNWFSHSFPRTLVVLACAAAIAAARGTVRDWAFLGAATAHVAAASAAAVRGAALPGGAAIPPAFRLAEGSTLVPLWIRQPEGWAGGSTGPRLGLVHVVWCYLHLHRMCT